jgi:hypothetical protein
MLNEIKLQLTALHPAQLQVTGQAKRFNVVCCGRRWGKTVLGIDRLIHAALQGKPVAWFAPNYRLLADAFRELQSTLAIVTIRTNQQEWRLELHGGGVVEMWSLDSPDAGRGRAYAVVVIDECAMVPNLQQAFSQTIRPMLSDYGGDAWFLSTPRGFNYFKTLFDRGTDPDRKEWASFQMPTASNPCICADEIESARLDLTEASFNQEYLAQFVNWEGSVFRRVGAAATAMPRTQPEAGHHYVIGCDWGRANDYTVFMVVDISTQAVVAMERSNRVDYTLQCERLKVLNERWQPEQIIAEQNSIGQPIIEQLTRDGLRIDGFTTTNASKAKAIESLALAFEREEIRILNDPVMIAELVAYQSEQLPSGLSRYGAPSGQHDDTVMALAMAWSAVSGQDHTVYPVPNIKIVVDDFEIPQHWPRGFGMDVRWHTAAAIWGARNPETDVLYLYSEYFGEAESAVHVAAIRARNASTPWIRGFIEAQANGRDEPDGNGLIQIYRSHSVVLQAIENPLESGVLNMSERIHSGRLKVFASCPKFLEQLRRYRRNDREQIVREHDNLQDASRCLVNVIGRLRPKPVTRVPPEPEHRGPRSWMS